MVADLFICLFFIFFKHRFHILHFPNSTKPFTKPSDRHYIKYWFSPDIGVAQGQVSGPGGRLCVCVCGPHGHLTNVDLMMFPLLIWTPTFKWYMARFVCQLRMGTNRQLLRRDWTMCCICSGAIYSQSGAHWKAIGYQNFEQAKTNSTMTYVMILSVKVRRNEQLWQNVHIENMFWPTFDI